MGFVGFPCGRGDFEVMPISRFLEVPGRKTPKIGIDPSSGRIYFL
jgi:hypothetical protein